ncbi:metallophosphoesterase [Providencia thailandensis]|uniref:Metallophosphoesterase n=1 Tax=Providencia stuartii TaxID=588 RepID=A0AAJ1N7X0_PROST|nr:metallophosphoesterase [Providencia thailandensis]MDE5307249.1 metallophosphoesterase [Providencia stuartii]MDE8752714.1 metallophosphoesterase [Providencia thailandensis]MDE8771899.1 metallophosphoesterase [Providencia thailandensis]MDE8776219.1 metallophosphoesterase [Providencia thailandensis]MDE8791667.1 metallophosphoesterase [Providencia thailandensis]
MTEERNGIYLRINGDQYRHIWVVGDIHGCFDLLNEKLQQIDFDKEKDLLISVGDLIDRGDQNVECLDLINEKWFRAVRGNHEQMAIDVVMHKGNRDCWMMNGGLWFFMQDYDNEVLSRACLAKAEKLPLIIEVNADGKKTVIAHADYPSDEYEFGKPVDEQYVIWSRERIGDENVREIKGADLFLFGHTPMIKGAVRRANQEYIDTGAVFGYGLTMRQIK